MLNTKSFLMYDEVRMYSFPLKVFLHCVRNQTDGTDPEERGTANWVLKADPEGSGYTNTGYDANDDPRAVRLHQGSPSPKHKENLRENAKESLERYKRAKGKGTVYSIDPDQNSTRGSARNAENSSELNGVMRTSNNMPTSTEEQARVNQQVFGTGSLGNAEIVLNGAPATENRKLYESEEMQVPQPTIHAPPPAPPAPAPYSLQVKSPQRKTSSGAVTTTYFDGSSDDPPHRHGSRGSNGDVVVVPEDYEESQRSLSRQSATDRRPSDDASSTGGASIVPGLHDSVSASVINIRL